MADGNAPHSAKFTLFSALAPELRIDIWRHALSEPRVVLFDDVIQSEENISLVGQACNLMNLPIINIILAREETRKEVFRIFQKIPVAPTSKLNVQSFCLPFVFFNFKLDTLYIEDIGKISRYLPRLDQVRKLVVASGGQEEGWARGLDSLEVLLQSLDRKILTNLQHLTLVYNETLTFEDFNRDWSILKLDLADNACVELPDGMTSHDIEQFINGVQGKAVQFCQDHGALAYECAKAKLRVAHLGAELEDGSGSDGASTSFKLPLNKYPDWSNIRISFGFVAKKERDSLQFYLVFPVYRSFPARGVRASSRWGHLAHDHWHLEAVEIGNGILQSCVVSQANDGRSTLETYCPKCNTRRLARNMVWFPLLENSAQDRA